MYVQGAVGGVYPGYVRVGIPSGIARAQPMGISRTGTQYQVPYTRPRHPIPGSHIPVPGTHIQGPICTRFSDPYVHVSQTHMYTFLMQNSAKLVPNSAKLVPNLVKTVPNLVKTVSKQCILTCTRRYTRPFDWNMEVQGGLKTCIPTAWSLNLGHQTVRNDLLDMS